MTANKSPQEIKEAVLHALHQVCPEADLEELDPDAILREELEIDSMDALRFIVLLHEQLGIDIPEKDYAKLTTINNCVAYFSVLEH